MQDFKVLFNELFSQCHSASLKEEYQSLSIQLQNGYLGHMRAYDIMQSFIDAEKTRDTIQKATEELISLYAETAPYLITKHIIKVSQKFRLVPREEQAMLDAFDEFIGARTPVPLTQDDIDNL